MEQLNLLDEPPPQSAVVVKVPQQQKSQLLKLMAEAITAAHRDAQPVRIELETPVVLASAEDNYDPQK